MKVLRAALIAVLLLPSAEAGAAPRNCFSPKEALAMQMVRHGIRLREGAMRCQEAGYSPGAVELWRKVDGAVGSQFKEQTDLRREAYQREFEKWAEWNLTVWDGRIVHYFRYRPLSRELCGNLSTMLKEVDEKGWKAFSKQADLLRNEVRLDYRICAR